jgi:hypothetical protein
MGRHGGRPSLVARVAEAQRVALSRAPAISNSLALKPFHHQFLEILEFKS